MFKYLAYIYGEIPRFSLRNSNIWKDATAVYLVYLWKTQVEDDDKWLSQHLKLSSLNNSTF